MKTRISILITLFAVMIAFGQTTRHNRVKIGVAPLAAETDEIIAIKPNGLIVNSGIRVEDIIGGVGTPSTSNYTLTEDEAANTITLNRDGLPISSVNLENYLDNTNLARIVSASYNGSTLILTRDDNSTINVPISTSSSPFKIVNVFVAPQGPDSQTLQQRMTNGLNAKDPDITIGNNELGLVDTYFRKNGKTYKNTWFIKESGRSYGVNSPQVSDLIYEPVIVNQILRNEADNRIELGNIGISEIQDAVNAQDPPIVIDRTSIVVATQNLQQREWFFNGDTDTYGVGASQSVAQDFVLLNDETGNDTGQPFIPTLQQVTDEDSFTNNRITVNGINSEADVVVEALTLLDDDLVFTGELFNQRISANALATQANNFTLPRTGTRLLSEDDLVGTTSFTGAQGYRESGSQANDLIVDIGQRYGIQQQPQLKLQAVGDFGLVEVLGSVYRNNALNKIFTGNETSFNEQVIFNNQVNLEDNAVFNATVTLTDDINISTGAIRMAEDFLLKNNLNDTSETFNLPTQSGTLALLSDIPSNGGSTQNLQQVTDEGSTTTNSIEALSFKTTNGTNQQVVAGDGSLLDVSSLGGGGGSPTGLEAIDEGNGVGWRLIGRDAANYGNIGEDAIDFSFSENASVEKGAIGLASFAAGLNNVSNGIGSAVFGRDNSNNRSYSFVSGINNIVNGFSSSAFGTNNAVRGHNTVAFGEGHVTSTTEHAIWLGSFSLGSLDEGPKSTRLLVVGNGIDENQRSNAFSVYKDGSIQLYPVDISNITLPQIGSIIIDSSDGNKLKFYDGTAWRTVSFQ